MIRSLALVVALCPLAVASQASSQGTPVDLFVGVPDAVASVPANDKKIVREHLGALRLDVLEQSAERQGGFGRLALPLFDGEVIVTRVARVEQAANDGWVWVGTIEGSVEDSVMLSVVGDTVVGSIHSQDRLFAVRYAGAGLHALAEIDQSGFDGCGTEAGGHDHSQAGAPAPLGPVVPLLPGLKTPAKALAAGAANNPPTIDILVVYTPEARSEAGGTSAMDALINLAITETNDAYAQSQVDQEVRLVGTAEMTGYTESGSIFTELSRLTTFGDGFLDQAHTLRNQYAADAVDLIVADGGGTCGVAHLMKTPDNTFSQLAFSCTVRSCATGYYSFGHELGHNFGSHHNNNGGGVPGASFLYSFGFRTADNVYRTIMSGSPGLRIRRFSNPNITYNGYAMGIADPDFFSAENWKSLNNTAPVTSQWRCANTVQYGTGKLTSTGLTPVLSGVGSPQVSVSGFKLELAHAEPNKSAIAFYGFVQADKPWNGGSLYVSGFKQRLGVQTTNANGAGIWDFPLTTGFVPGDQLFAQVWFRDPTHPDGTTAGLSNGLRIDVCD